MATLPDFREKVLFQELLTHRIYLKTTVSNVFDEFLIFLKVAKKSKTMYPHVASEYKV